MKTENYPVSLQDTEEETSLANTVKEWDENCKNCRPLTPLTCVTDCKIWKQKNELRILYEKMKKPRFMTGLLNTLKNKRRLQILDVISKSRHSISKLQKKLKKLGYYHSQQTRTKEYITPLIEVGLAKENQNHYHTTLFGCRLNEIMKEHYEIGDILPAHSECYEEIALSMLLNKPKTYEDFKGIIPAKSVARVLNRLRRVKLIETAKENEYVFYFKTRRDSNTAKYSLTERRVYESIPSDGISARKLAEKTGISLRRTYKYLRRLRGKKLVFTRERPKSYALTAKGFQVATMLNCIRNLILEVFAAASQIINKEETHKLLMPDTTEKVKIKEKVGPLTTIQSKN